MNKTLINFWLDCLLLILFCLLGWISAVLRFLFPLGPSVFEYQLWGWDYIDWSDAQFIVLCVFAAAILLHVMLHWTWVVGVVTRRIAKSEKKTDHSLDTIYGVVLLIALLHVLGIAFAAAMFTIEGPAVG
ncbi:MAG: DUF4405 domain-containing protein [Planctomycetaceae bacterium]|nr:DUF4405 domain-containing protein [Planctomycetaceae bacterium]